MLYTATLASLSNLILCLRKVGARLGQGWGKVLGKVRARSGKGWGKVWTKNKVRARSGQARSGQSSGKVRARLGQEIVIMGLISDRGRR